MGFLDQLTGDDGTEEVQILSEEYYQMLDEIDQQGGNTGTNYKSLEMNKGKLQHAEETLGIITGYPRDIMITKEGYSHLLQYRVSKAFQAQNEILENFSETLERQNQLVEESTGLIDQQNEMLEESSALNEEMKEHTVKMSRLTKWILGFTAANLVLLIVQIAISMGVL